MAAIAGAFCPNRFDITSDTRSARLAATSIGCTTAVLTASNSAIIAAA
ncbi:Uncharacterised protein [Mycobacterium tuberculosis]|uniref:Uncharacterized protein n=1 Tax=Mycobacterium tuberculosis TaxID=1773 RepID=A0A655C7B0_MYCTX|nr:Uncharacterised protein [Mycobacterium tuberculosis]CKQ80301.1 Uncharacterised protein [Mycobacterium tuberculosis]CKQ83732.1 Uncharacterised protein [Mycobacterium tuberculosis]CKQ90341.1 Uncharacterised protein [Mycobacterium tuberculosis]CKR07955.1 Uncharacterised protein [Mycobacterium tuberculosis]